MALFGLDTVTRKVVFSVYLVLYTLWAIFTHFTRDGPQSSAMMIVNTQFYKVMGACILWRISDGSFGELWSAIQKESSTVLIYGLPASLYALSDIMRTNVIRATDMQTYAVLFNLRMVVLALIWERVLDRQLLPVHWLSLLLICVGCIVKEWHAWNPSNSVRMSAYMQIIALGIMTAFSAVINEKLLKDRPNVALNLQALSMASWGLLWAVAVSYREGTMSINALGFIAQSPLLQLQALCFAAFGLCTGWFLKELSNITREIAVGICALITVPLNLYIFHIPVMPSSTVGLFIVVGGVGLYGLYPLMDKKALKEDDKVVADEKAPLQPKGP